MTLTRHATPLAVMAAVSLSFAASAWPQARKRDLSQPPADGTAATDPSAAESEAPPAEASPPATAPPADDEAVRSASRLTVLLLPLVPKRVDPALAATVDALLAAELGRRDQLKIVTMADLNALLTAERLKDLVGCDDVSCSSDVSGAVGAERILAGSLGHLGPDLILELTWIDADYSTPLAHVVETATGGETTLRATVHTALGRLFTDSADDDARAREHKAHPTFWTAELGVGPALRQGSEPYARQATADLRLAWGGKSRSLGLFFYGVGGVGLSYFDGSAVTRIGRLTYGRTQLTPFVEGRLGIPVDSHDRLRLFAGAGIGLDVEWYHARQTDGVAPHGTRMVPELRGVAGAWYRWRPLHSFFAQYVGRLQLMGSGADSVSELAEQRSTRPNMSIHAFELGWALHF